MNLSAIRVLAGSAYGVHGFLSLACRPGADRRLLNVVRCVRGPENLRTVLCGPSNNSVNPIQREIRILSRYLCSSDSQAQPSKGTQGNNGFESPLADGNTSRAVQSHLSLARVQTSCREALRRGPLGENPDPTEKVQAGACRDQTASVEAIYVAPNGVNCSTREIGKSGFVASSLNRSPPT